MIKPFAAINWPMKVWHIAIIPNTFVSKVVRTSGIERSITGCVCVQPLFVTCEFPYSPHNRVREEK